MLVRVQERGPNAGNASAALQASQELALTYAKIIGAGALKGEIGRFVAQCRRLRTATTQNRPGAPSAQGNSQSLKNATGPPAGSCKSLGVTGNSRLSPRSVSEVSLSASPVQDLDLLSITTRSKDPTNARIAANAVPWALRAFIRDTGSATTEKIITVKAATTPSAPVSRHLGTEHRARNHARAHLQRSPGPSARVLPRSASRARRTRTGDGPPGARDGSELAAPPGTRPCVHKRGASIGPGGRAIIP